MEKSSEKAQFSCLKLLAFVVACFVLLIVLFPVFAKHREIERRDTCLNHEKQIVAAIQMYVQDNHGNLPSDPWTSCVVPYLPDPEHPWHTMYCPSDAVPGGATWICSYGINGSLLHLDASGINAKQINFPADVPLISDANPSRGAGEDTYIPSGGLLQDAAHSGVPFARHSRGIVVAFCDGHVQYVPTDFTPADCANPVIKGFYECVPLGLVNNPGGGLPLSTDCTRKDYRYPNDLIIGGEFATMPLLAEMAEVWKQHGKAAFYLNDVKNPDSNSKAYWEKMDYWKSNKDAQRGPKPKLDYRNTGFQGEYSVKPASLSKNYLWGTVDDAAGTAIAHDALVVIVAKNTKLPPNNVGGLTTIANSSTPSNGWYCCNTATIAAWFTDGYAANQWQAYTYGTALATTGQLARYLALPAGKDHRPVFGTRCRVVNNDREMVARVANDPAGIGFCSSACVDYDRVQVVGIQDTAGKQYYFPNRDAKYRTWLPLRYPDNDPDHNNQTPIMGAIPDIDWPRALIRNLKITSAGEGTKILLDIFDVPKDGWYRQKLMNGPLFACSYW